MKKSKELASQIQTLHIYAKKDVQRLRAELKKATETEAFWEKYLEYIERNWVLHILNLLEKESSRLKNLREVKHPIIPYIEDSYRSAKEESNQLFRRYPALLEKACNDVGLKLDRNHPHPRYSLENGFFTIEIDESKTLARISNYESRLAELPADIDAIIEVIKQEHERIFGRKFEGDKFLKQLRRQYNAILKKDKFKDGDSIPIRQITKRMGKNIKGFRTDEFLIDLSLLAEKGPFEIDNRRIDLQQTKDTNQGMLLYGAEKRGYIGFIKFREV